MARKKKTSSGRKKIEMKKIENEDALQVCFSKRKTGVFAKAADLSTLCGAELAIFLNSPVGNPYCFGSPAMKPVADRFLLGNLAPQSGPDLSMAQALNQQSTELSSQFEVQKQKKDMLENQYKMLLQASIEAQWVENIGSLNMVELEKLNVLLEGLNERLHKVIVEHVKDQEALTFNTAPVDRVPTVNSDHESIANHASIRNPFVLGLDQQYGSGVNSFDPATNQSGPSVNFATGSTNSFDPAVDQSDLSNNNAGFDRRFN